MSDSGCRNETKTLELSGRTRQRFERIKEQCKTDHVPAPEDEEMLKSLLDTWEAVGEGYYSDDSEVC